MTTPWLYDENSQFYTKICDFWLLRTWFMAQDDSALKRTKKNWSVQHDAEKDVATIEKLANYLGASCFFTCWHSNTADGIGEPQSPRVYIYIYNKPAIHKWATNIHSYPPVARTLHELLSHLIPQHLSPWLTTHFWSPRSAEKSGWMNPFYGIWMDCFWSSLWHLYLGFKVTCL